MSNHGIARRWTSAELVADLRTMVAEMDREDYVYVAPLRGDVSAGACDYVRCATGEGPGHGCIVGEWLRRQGVDMAAIDAWQQAQWNRGWGNGPSVGTMYPNDDDDAGPDTALPVLTETAREVLISVQTSQDLGATWGRAVATAAEAVNLGSAE